jgi:hypothetical protein
MFERGTRADIDNTPLFFAASRTEARFQPKTVKNFVKNFRKILTTLPRRRTRNARRRKDAGLKVTSAPCPGRGGGRCAAAASPGAPVFKSARYFHRLIPAAPLEPTDCDKLPVAPATCRF